MFYPWSYYFTEKKKTHQTFTRNSPTTDFRATFLYNRRCLTSGKTKSRDENKVAETELGNFYWERRLCLIWILLFQTVKFVIMIRVRFHDMISLNNVTQHVRPSKTAFKCLLKAFLGINILLFCDKVFCFILSSTRIKCL